MNYMQLAELYQNLSENSRRLKKTVLIADFLKTIGSREELGRVVLLLQGRVFSQADKNVLGMSEKLLIKAIETASGASEKKVLDTWRSVGDLGEVAGKLLEKKTQSTLFSEDLTIKNVFETLKKLARMEGGGSTGHKVKVVSQLLSNAQGVEAVYVVRSVLGDLRVGVSDGTLRDSILYAFLHPEYTYDKENNKISPESSELKNELKDLQSAIDKSNDFSLVARIAKEEGLLGLTKVGIEPGRALKVMLAQKVVEFKEGFDKVGLPCAIEFKYDGFRCIGGHTPIYTKENGLVSAKDVKKGYHVLTHKGRFKKVLETNKRIIDKGERVFKIQSWLGHQISITEGHPLLVKREKKLTWVDIENVKKKDILWFPKPTFIEKNHLGKILTLSNSAGYKKQIPVNNFFFRFLGFWLGDGYTNNYHNTERIGLVFNARKEKVLAKFYEENIKKYFHIKNLSRSLHNGGLQLYWRDKPMRIWLSTHFRREWKGKYIPFWLHAMNKKQFISFLQGWFEADGHEDAQGRKSITTKERDVAMNAQLIALRHGQVIGVKKFRVKETTYYKLILCKANNRSFLLDEKGIEVSIRKIEEVKRPDPRKKVYNFQVEDDESYCTTLFTFHNCQIHKKTDGKIKIFTRRLEEVTAQFPDIVAAVQSGVRGKSFIIDAEAVGYDPESGKYKAFQDISQRIRRKYEIEKLVKKLPVELCVFDVLHFEGNDLLDLPFTKRRAFLESMISTKDQAIRISKFLEVNDEATAKKFYEESLVAGNEGIMIKKLDALYQPGSRVGTWIKLKPVMDTLDLAIVGAEWGTGKRSGWLTSFTLACFDESTEDLVTLGKFGTGIKEKEEAALAGAVGSITFEEITKRLKPHIISTSGREVEIEPDVIVEVKFEEIQKSPTYESGYALRFPRFVQLRDDRGVDDMTTLSTVEAAYKRQRGR